MALPMLRGHAPPGECRKRDRRQRPRSGEGRHPDRRPAGLSMSERPGVDRRGTSKVPHHLLCKSRLHEVLRRQRRHRCSAERERTDHAATAAMAYRDTVRRPLWLRHRRTERRAPDRIGDHAGDDAHCTDRRQKLHQHRQSDQRNHPPETSAKPGSCFRWMNYHAGWLRSVGKRSIAQLDNRAKRNCQARATDALSFISRFALNLNIRCRE